MTPTASSEKFDGFPASTRSQSGFTGSERFERDGRYVRKSGRMPDAVRTYAEERPCWHHDDRFACAALANKLEADRETRRLTSIGLDLAIWMHARSEPIPKQREFLARYASDWNGHAPPPVGLARGAALYHLPDAGQLTLAERFVTGAPLFGKLCAAERVWLRAQRHARISFFRVMRVKNGVIRLRDWFGALSGRGDVTVRDGEIPRNELAAGHTVFARLVAYRGRHYVDLLQARTSVRECIADPGAAPMSMWQMGERLRDRSVMVQALFATWKRET